MASTGNSPGPSVLHKKTYNPEKIEEEGSFSAMVNEVMDFDSDDGTDLGFQTADSRADSAGDTSESESENDTSDSALLDGWMDSGK